MRYTPFPPLDRELSELVFGALYLSLGDLDASFAMLDEWSRCGGNVIDSAHGYGFIHGAPGDAERVLGKWFAERPQERENVVLISKGAHFNQDRNRVTAEDITSDLRDTLARIDRPVDLYMLHRDDPTVPVEPVVDVLNEHKRDGLIRAFGASNWSTERIDQANEYAVGAGLEGFCCSSSQLSLAAQQEPLYPGSISAGDAESRSWHERNQMPLFAWSAQAGGFFTGAYSPHDRSNQDMVRVYYQDANWERLRRAKALAAERGTDANAVALSWVLHQPFPTFGIIGPQTPAELQSSLAALDIVLTRAEQRWLNLESAERDD